MVDTNNTNKKQRRNRGNPTNGRFQGTAAVKNWQMTGLFGGDRVATGWVCEP